MHFLCFFTQLSILLLSLANVSYVALTHAQKMSHSLVADMKHM